MQTTGAGEEVVGADDCSEVKGVGAGGGRSGTVNMDRKKLIKLANVMYAASPVSISGTFDGGGANVSAQVGRTTVKNTMSMVMA